MARVLVFLVRFAGFGICMLLLGGYLGEVHPIGDALAVPRLWIAGVLFGVAGLALALKDRVAAGLLGGFAGFAAIPILWLLWWPFEPPDRVDATVYVKNLGHNRIEVDAVAMDINEIDPDIILLQELTQHDAVWLRTLLPNHPHWHICQHTPISGVAVIARWPLSETGCTPRRGIAFGDVAAPGGSIWAASIHLIWPYPYAQWWDLPMIERHVNREAPRRIVAGDFNMVPWGRSIQRVAEFTGTAPIGRLQTTILGGDFPLPIDHVLTNGTGDVTRRPQFGSDHFGLVARIGFDGVD